MEPMVIIESFYLFVIAIPFYMIVAGFFIANIIRSFNAS